MYARIKEKIMAMIDVFSMAPRKDDPPYPPYVQLWLAARSEDASGHIFLSAQLVTEGEIDAAVNLLEEQLEKARVKAKKNLQKAIREQREVLNCRYSTQGNRMS
jgi:hypothetical protein